MKNDNNNDILKTSEKADIPIDEEEIINLTRIFLDTGLKSEDGSENKNSAVDAAPFFSEQMEKTLERVIKKLFSEKIESVIADVIEKAVTKEIDKLKHLLLKDTSDEEKA